MTATQTFERKATLRLIGMTSLMALGVALLPTGVQAQDIPEEEMVDLGALGGDRSIATKVNSDGSVVFGYAQNEAGAVRMVLWQNGVANDITLPGVVYNEALLDINGSSRGLMSRDGSTVVIRAAVDLPEGGIYRYHDGTATRIDQPSAPGELVIEGVTALDRNGSTLVGFSFVDGDQHAVRWTEEGAQDIGVLGGTASSALAVSGDGSIVVGISDVDGGSREAFRWSGGTMQSLGALAGQTTGGANLISDDGSVIAGYARVLDGTGGDNSRVFVWQDGVMSDIGDLGGANVTATAISTDGSTIIGQSGHDNPEVSTSPQAFYWRDGVMQEVGYLPTDDPDGAYTVAKAVSGDGGVIVGTTRGEVGGHAMAFRWTEDGGIVALGTLGGTSSRATDVSEDGTTIVGLADNAEGQSRAFIWRSVMQDFTNLLASFGGLAEESELAIEEQQQFTEIAAAPGCDPAQRRFCLGVEGYGWTSAGTATVGRREAIGARLFAGVGLTEGLSIGGGYAWVDPSIKDDRTHESGAHAWSVSLDYRGATSGPFARLWYAHARESLSLVRGEGFADVQPMNGSAGLSSDSFGLRAGYGFALPGGMNLRPWAAFDRRNSERDEFLEAGGDFPARFAAIEAKRTVARAGIDMELPTGQNPLRLGISLETDLTDDPIMIAGTSDIPGMESFTLTSSLDRKDVRARFGVGYDLPLGPLVIGIGASAKSPVYGSSWQIGGAVRVSTSF